MRNVLKKCIIFSFLLLFFISISAFSYVNAVFNDISDSVFRLHIIASSDSVEDQALKYKVRNKIIEYMNSISNENNTKSKTIKLVNDNLEKFKQIAKQVIEENGYDYSVNVSMGNFAFPTKKYGDISLPAGFYDALKIEIGDANGQNWWCVMFPPLCFVDVTNGIVPDESKELIHKELSDEEYELISNETPEMKFKFKLLELFTSVTDTFMAKKL